MIDKSKVLLFVKEKGPVLPKDIVKQFGGDTFITGAVLNTMVDSKEIKISFSKIGGSPVYYYPGQEEKLSILYQYLPGKEKEAFTLLKEMKLIKDSTAEPAIRVAFRNIKDFAKPIEVNIGETKEVFWKWHLFPNQDAERAIREFFLPKKSQETEQRAEKIEDQKSIKGKDVAIEKKTEQKAEEPQHEKKQEEQREEKTIKIQKPKPEQKKLVQEKKREINEEKQKKQDTEDALLQRISKLFFEKGIEILEKGVIKKNYEVDMIVMLPTPVGSLKYFCKIRDKKKTSEKDMASLFAEAQMKKMPALYVTTGEITKKAKDLVDQEFKTITTMHI